MAGTKAKAAVKRRAPRKTMSERTEETRRSIIDAALETIRDVGYYRATSNEIARKAEVTWGAIQHHFGTREALILTVLEGAIEEITSASSGLVIRGVTLEERLGELWDCFFTFYGQPHYLAILQILLDLSHDPAFGKRARDVVDGYYKVVSKTLRDLAPKVWLDDPGGAKEASIFIDACWGIAVSAQVRGAAGTRERPGKLAQNRDTLIRRFAAG